MAASLAGRCMDYIEHGDNGMLAEVDAAVELMGAVSARRNWLII